ncbi:hypothetical protein C5952_10465 [Cronobacter sakazakii]|uniref:hypothetical protein n=1 Tax=Cronobacter sakazakii TaxID=28141 RepID=UPI0002B262EC|nr:hypothetical protein [Cronobacter sakazakii]MDK1222648.1 hypothetical protein [Cronobacter turicensis]AGE87719.1 hypothetical protein CSSP291_15740 [Cronobacter sakazakii SP291]ALB51900.1 hypothetical protein AFK64_15460 [Cronobacter sakazakii]EGT0040193.1 hypothetical protein [Cronobacter sakazakii]EGT4386197.1 hypothetical protein [Cronobacter sakazakii]
MSTESDKLKLLAKRVGKYFVALLPYSTLLSGAIIWSYLTSIGRLDLLMGAFSFNIGLVSLLISAAVFSLATALTLVLPSAILLAHREINPGDPERYFNKGLPWICFSVSFFYLTLVFLPHTTLVKKLTGDYVFSVEKILLITALFATLLVICFNFGFLLRPLKPGKRQRVWLVLMWAGVLIANTFFILLPGLSISIPAGFLIHSSRGEGSWAVVFAWVFISLFSLLAFLPAIVHYSQKSDAQNNSGAIKNFFVTAFIAVVFIVLLFPTLWSTLVFGSLVSIGLVDTQPHYYRVDDEKFSPALFPQTVWQTQEMPGRDEKAFFIRGVNLFSTGSVNLICPAYIVKLRAQATARDYANFIPGNNEASVRYFRQMMKGCVVFETGEIRQWDTLFDANGAIKK